MAPSTSADRAVLLLLSALALVTRFAMLAYPRQVVWDEHHFGKFVNGYLSGAYFFDIHPPLGKLLLALSAWAGGYDGAQTWEKIGTPIAPAVPLLALRGPSALQGSALVPLAFAASRAMGVSTAGSLLPACGVLFDACYLAESRLVLTDATLLLGFALQIWGCAASDAHPPLSRAWAVRVGAAGVGIALASCTKWTGLATLATAGLHSLWALARAAAAGWRARRDRPFAPPLLAHVVARLALLLALPAAAYVLCFRLHFSLLPNTGDGARFMTPRFRATLRNGTAAVVEGVMPPSFWEKFVELNREMLRANSTLKKEHRWASHWWEWPLMLKTILYWRANGPPYVTCLLYTSPSPRDS